MARILVADDSEADRYLAAYVLRSEGHEVLEAEDGMAALEIVRETPVDLVVSDLVMPGMDGYELAYEIRQEARLEKIPILFFSATFDREELKDVSVLFADCHFVAKPAGPEQIMEAVRRALSSSVEPAPLAPSDQVQVERLRLLSTKLVKVSEEAENGRRQLAARVAQQEAIAVLGQAALAGSDLVDLVELVPKLLRDTLAADAAGVFALVPGEDELVMRAGDGWRTRAGWQVDIGAGHPAARAVRTGQSVGFDEHELAEGGFRQQGVLAGAFAPVKRLDGTPALLGAFSRGPRHFSTDDLNFMVAAAHVISQAAEREHARAARERAVDELEAAEQRFRSLVESAPDGIITVGTEGRIEFVNRQAEDMFGYRAAELLGERVEVLVPERFRSAHVLHRTGYVDDPRLRPMGAELDLWASRKDGTEFPVEIRLAPIGSGEDLKVMSLINDVTEVRLKEQELRKSVELLRAADEQRRDLLDSLVRAQEEERRRIADDIHDDSIQVMTALVIRLETMRRRIDDTEVLDTLDAVESTARESISRLRKMMFELRPLALDRDGLAAAVRLYLEQTMAEAEIAYAVVEDLPEEPDSASQAILYRIAKEALNNVVKHAGASRVDVRLERSNGGTLVRVIDDGRGFEAEGSTALPGHLGLSSMSERAELSGGWWRVESEPTGGTTVEFFVPDRVEPARVEWPQSGT